MWNNIKKISNWVFRIFLAIFVIGFMFLLFITVMSPELIKNSLTVNWIGLIGLLLSFPGIVNQLAHEVNPKKKKYKLNVLCQNCNSHIDIQMVEE